MVEPSSKPKKPLVVITGVSGYLGSQILATFVIGDGRGNYRVRATVRDKNNEAKMKPLRDALEEAYSEVEFFNADLLNEDGWSTAIEGADYVVHTASPVQMNNPTDHDILIKPAVNGVDYVMKAAIRHGVKRVVMTSSVAAVMSVPERDAPEVFDESCWSEEQHAKNHAYTNSKTLAEKCAWKHQKESGIELVTICPSMILGETLVPGSQSSIGMIQNMMDGKYRSLVQLNQNLCDVKDVALAHLRALEVPEAANNRYIISNAEGTWMRQIAEDLESGLLENGRMGYPIPNQMSGYCSLKFLSYFISDVADILPILNRQVEFSNEKARKDLRIEFKRSVKDLVTETAMSLIKLGVIEDKKI